MDSRFIIKRRDYFLFLTFGMILISSYFSISECQLTQTDMNYIKKTLLSFQDESTGLFSKSVENTYKAISSLKILNEPILHISKICKEIGYESMNQLSLEIIKINDILNCKNSFNIPSELKDEEMLNVNLETLYRRASMASWTKAKVNWGLLYENLKPFITDVKFFSNENAGQTYSLRSTVLGLKLLIEINKNVDEATKELVKEEIVLVFTNVQNEFQLIRENIGLFLENNVKSIRINSEIAETLISLNSLINIENIEEVLLLILNYFVNFKYEYTNLDNIYYLLQGLQNLADLPIVSLDKNFFDYSEEQSVVLRLVNGFGRELNELNSTFKFVLKEEQEEKPSAKGEFDLEDEPTDTENYEGEVKSNISTIKLDLTNKIHKPGKFLLDVKASFTNKQNSTFEDNFDFTLISTSKVKLNHLKMAVTNTKEKIDEKEITVEYPKRTFKNFQATQNSIIKLKVKLNYGGNQVNKIEQIFLRLRNTEIGKTYSGYVSEYKSLDDYHYINFDMSDPTHMEAYDGLYELTLIVSDASFENPMIWNFGKIDVKFKKPLNPNDLTPTYKNAQKNKMEPSFPVEESPNKNIVTSLVFSTAIIGLLVYYLVYLKTNKANMEKFKKGIDSIFSIGFVIFLLLSTYVMILFFIKLNIIQTLVTIIAISIPGSVIVYKALSSISIEV